MVIRFNSYLPAVQLGLFGVACALLSTWKWKVKTALAAAVLVVWLPVLHREQPALLKGPTIVKAPPGSVRIMTWNVKSYSWGMQDVIDRIIDESPDVLCLVEGTFSGRKPEKLAKQLGSEYHWAVGRQLSIASRYPIRESQTTISDSDLKIFRSIIELPGGPIAVSVVDLSPPRRRRDQFTFDALHAAMQTETFPALFTGDFNSQRGSWWLGRATRGWRDAAVEAGNVRYLATWPNLPIGIWNLDYTFVNSGINLMSFEIKSTTQSDHRPIFTTIFQEGAGD